MYTKESQTLKPTESRIEIFKALLPLNWEFIQKDNVKLHCDPYRKAIFIPSVYFYHEGNYFSLAHEIGHAHINERKEFFEIDEEMFLRDKMNHLGKESLDKKEQQRYKILVIGTEIEAWKYAIKTISFLKAQGEDVEPTFTQNDLFKIAKNKLKTYFLKTLDK